MHTEAIHFTQFKERCSLGAFQLVKIMKRIFHRRKYDAVVRLLDGEEFSTEVTVRCLQYFCCSVEFIFDSVSFDSFP